jgi:hypothetical protein
VGDKIKVPTAHSELRKSFILTAAILLTCDALVPFKDGSWFMELATVNDGRTEAWVEGPAKMEGLVSTTECAAEANRGGRDGGEDLIANF